MLVLYIVYTLNVHVIYSVIATPEHDHVQFYKPEPVTASDKIKIISRDKAK